MNRIIIEPVYLDPEKEKKQKITEQCLDCYFYRGQNSYQKCIALSNTDFGERACPFHKTEKEQAESLEISEGRLRRIGLQKEQQEKIKKNIDDFFFF